MLLAATTSTWCRYAFVCIVGFRSWQDISPRSTGGRDRLNVDRDSTSAKCTHLLVAPRDWPDVAVVNGASTTWPVHGESDGPLCTACTLLLDTPGDSRTSRRRQVVDTMVWQKLSISNNVVEQVHPHHMSTAKPTMLRHIYIVQMDSSVIEEAERDDCSTSTNRRYNASKKCTAVSAAVIAAVTGMRLLIKLAAKCQDGNSSFHVRRKANGEVQRIRAP